MARPQIVFVAKDDAADVPPLRVAFIGAGAMARLHLRSLQRVATRHRVVGVHDLDETTGEDFAGQSGALYYADLGELLGTELPDIVHVCTPPGTHAEAARLALEAGAHVYVEKPFVETLHEAEALLELAGRRARLVCAGHQLMRDPAFLELARRIPTLGHAVRVDSTFSFRPVGIRPDRAEHAALARQLLDVLPHPLYTLVALLDAEGEGRSPVEMVAVSASATELHAVLRAGEGYGRLAVSLRARPITSLLTFTGEGGTLTADFIRGTVVGVANPGTEPLEKVLNPLTEGCQLVTRSIAGLARRLLGGGHYPGLSELLTDFYQAVARGGSSPLAPDHLRRVADLYEQLAARVRRVAGRTTRPRAALRVRAPEAALAVVTGARGFLGREVAKELVRRGFRVRGISRTPEAYDPNVAEWCTQDLAREIRPDAFGGAAVVVHAAAETAGGYQAHRRNSVDATRRVLEALPAAGVSRLVYVSSLSVLRPPRSLRERQDERTPLPRDARRLGPYTWGKCEAERIITDEAAAYGVAARILRPAALIDWEHPELPGLVGRPLLGRWLLGFGRPATPFAVCALHDAAAAVAWSAACFDEAPPVVNLVDPRIGTRGELVALLRSHGWRGRIAWMPIPIVSLLFLPSPLAVWAILRPRRYDHRLAERVLAAARLPAPRPPEAVRATT